MSAARSTIPCDRRGCEQPAAWRYRIATMGGVEVLVACQQHVREVRDMHGPNVLAVTTVAQDRFPIGPRH